MNCSGCTTVQGGRTGMVIEVDMQCNVVGGMVIEVEIFVAGFKFLNLKVRNPLKSIFKIFIFQVFKFSKVVFPNLKQIISHINCKLRDLENSKSSYVLC